MPITQVNVAALLKQETSAAHLTTEKTLIPHLTAIRSNADYIRILKTFYGFYAPLQQSILKYISPDELPDIHERRNVENILSDIKSLHQPIDHLPLCDHMPEIHNVAMAFGAMYVTEGSTLGGAIICNILRKNSHLSLTENNLRFFNAYGSDNMAKWSLFTEALNQQTHSEVMIATANETFTLFKNWIQESHQ